MSVFVSQLRVEQRIFWRNLSSVLFTFVIPLGLLLALVVSGDTIHNASFIVALVAVATGFQGLSIQLAMHREQGVLKRMMATPLRMSTLVAAKTASIFLVVLIETIFVIAISVAFFDASMPHDYAALIVIMLLGTATFVALGFALAALISSADAAPAVSSGAYIALLGLTALLAQVDSLPHWLRQVGHFLPVYALLDGVRRAWFGSGGSFVQAVLVTAAWGALGLLVTAWRFRWEPAGER